MNGYLASPWMLWGLLGVSIPVIIHLLSRRRTVTVDWGAMQFLDIGRRAQRKFQITELLLMAGRMLLLALVALALARPFWKPKSDGMLSSRIGGGREPRDCVLILDGSESMDRKVAGTSPRSRATAWMTTFADGMKPGDSKAAILVARDRVRPITDGLSYDPTRVKEAIKAAPASRGSSDLASAVSEALRVLESGKNSDTEIVILADAQRLPWRPGDTGRWNLLRELRARLKGRAPRLSAITFGGRADGSDAAVGPIVTPRGVYPPNASIPVSTFVTNSGPDAASRSAEMLIDGAPVAGTTQAIGPIPPGGKVPLSFRATIAAPGAHLIGVRISGADDALAANDLAERPVEVAEALPVLLVDGEPGVEPLSGETDFLRAALAPAEDEAPAVRARVVKASEFNGEALKDRRVLVLANVDRLDASQSAALIDFLDEGGGVLIAPGDRTDTDAWNQALFADGNGPLPASFGEMKGNFGRREAVAHPSPRSFTGPALGPFGQGDSPPLGEADLFAYRVLSPSTGTSPSAVIARLDTRDPWAVERPYRKGRVILMSGPLDAEGGTLPVNPDFVPLVHEIIYRLADPSADSSSHRPGDSIRVNLAEAPPPEATSTTVTRPDGTTATAPIVRDGAARVVLSDTSEPGVYRIALPGPSGGFAYASVASDARESEPDPLDPAEAAKLSEGWPLAFAKDENALRERLLDSAGGGPRPLWRFLVLAALGGLCLEVFLTRQLVKGRGMTVVVEDPS